MRLWALLLLALWSDLGNAQKPATVRISGVVTDSAGRAIPFANITALPERLRIVAGADGRFVIQVDSSVKKLDIRRIGFAPKVVEADVWPDTALRLSLVALPARLERVRVEAEQLIRSLDLHGFYEREAELEKGINHGFIITPEEIDQRKGARVTDFLLGRPAIRVAMVKPPPPFDRDSRAGLQPQGSGGCRMEIYIDGIRFYSRGPKDFWRYDRWGDVYINDLIPTSTIAAIEVYPRAVGAPPRYQSLNGNCGVILIWTR